MQLMIYYHIGRFGFPWWFGFLHLADTCEPLARCEDRKAKYSHDGSERPESESELDHSSRGEHLRGSHHPLIPCPSGPNVLDPLPCSVQPRRLFSEPPLLVLLKSSTRPNLGHPSH